MTRPLRTPSAAPAAGSQVAPAAVAALALASFAAVYLEVSLMKLASLRYSPIFVFAIIGVALLGYGAAGALLAARGAPAPGVLPPLVARALTGFAAVTVPVFLVLNDVDVPAQVIFGSLRGLPVLLGIYALLTLPFLLAGLAVAAIFTAFAEDVNRLYAADLAGAAAGSALAVASVPLLGGLPLLAVAGAAGGVGGVLAARGGGSRGRLPAAVAIVDVLLVGVLLAARGTIDVRVAPDKHGPLLAASAKPGGLATDFSQWSTLGRVDITEPFATLPPQFGGDVSTTFGDLRIEQRMLTLDGAAPAFLYRVPGSPKALEFLAGMSQSPAYRLRPHPRVLVIGVGGATDVLIALHEDAAHVTAVEINPVNAHAVHDVYDDYVGHVLRDPRVDLEVAEGRNFVARTTDRYDIVQLSGVDTGAALGAYGLGTMPESYVYTVEAMSDFLDRLAPDGVLTITRDLRFGWALRLASLARTALVRRGLDPGPRLFVLEGRVYGWATILAKREAFTDAEVAALRAWSARYDFPIDYDPLRPGTGAFDRAIRQGALADGDTDLRPSTDDWPFFFISGRWGHALRLLGQQANPLLNPIGFLIANLAGLTLVAVAVIVLPLLRLRDAWRATSGKTALVGYFSLLGIAYMLMEVALMQRFTIFLGNPVLAVATVLAALLLASGLGSSLARRRAAGDAGTLRLAVVGIVLGALFFASPPSRALVHGLLWLPLPARLAVVVALVGLVGIPMGMPFPAGLARVAARARPFVPWAWGVNGMLSVVSSLTSYFVGMIVGYTAMFWAAAALYVAALVLARRL